jgi:hypothetical protein
MSRGQKQSFRDKLLNTRQIKISSRCRVYPGDSDILELKVEESEARETAPLLFRSVWLFRSVLAGPMRVEPEGRVEPEAREAGGLLRKEKSAKAKKTLNARGARKKAQQQIYRSAAKLVDDLVEKAGGNYLAVKFLFDFAGMNGDAGNERPTESPLLKAYRQYLQKGGERGQDEQTPERNLNLSNGDGNPNVG